MADYTLPADILFSILLWLPVIDLLRLRAVCKSWCALIDSSSFINKHLLHQDHTNNDGALIVSIHIGNDWCLLSGHQFEDRVSLDLVTPLSVNIPQIFDDDNSWFSRIVASCNGIICLRIARKCDACLERRWNLALWNPATKQFTSLPDSPPYTAKICSFFLGFGCAVKTIDYKVVRICDLHSAESSLTSVAYERVEVYSLKTCAWRTINVELPTCGRIQGNEETYSNGHYSWLFYKPDDHSTSYVYSIISFDLSDEVFRFIPLPDVLSSWPQLTTIRDSIACIDILDPNLQCRDLQGNGGRFDIWVLNEFGVKESWTKLYTIRLIGNFDSLTTEGLSKDGKFMLLNIHDESGYHLALADRDTEEIKNIPIKFCDVAVYKESLVSIKKKSRLIDATCVV